ncbi:MAG: trigger factor [Actinomycetota bacterium]|nr:trigger factor [Actinomycetota bacterium]
MKTTVTELDDSRARVEVEVPADEVSVQVQRAARAMAREMRMPGFRKGKAPPSLAIQRLGYESVFEEALREALPQWYEKSVYASGVVPIGDPDVEVTRAPTADGETVEFKFEVGVRPTAELGEYLGLEVEKAGTDVPDEVIERELERLREGMSSLDVVERAAADGDHVLVDFVGRLDDVEFEGGAATDHTIIIGSGQLIDDFEEQLIGASAGDEVKVEVTFPEEYGAAELAGQDAVFDVTVKEVREQKLPEIDDDFAAEASEFDTVEELRKDIAEKVGESAEQRIDQEFRTAAIDAAVANAKVGIPENIVKARGQERWDRVERQMASQGMDPETYLQMQGKTRDEIIDESLEDAEREIRREAVLVAIAEAEGFEISDEELESELEHMASHERTTAAKLLERLKRDGRHEMVAADIRVRKAIDAVADAAKATEMPAKDIASKIWGIEPDDEDEAAGDEPETTEG